VKLAITKDIGVMGLRVSELVKARGGIAGINAELSMTPMEKGTGLFQTG